MGDEEFSAWQKKFIMWVFVAIVGGNAGTLLNAVNPDIRSDPFTGADGMEHEQRLDVLENHMGLSAFRMQLCESYHTECKNKLEKIEEHIRRHD